MTSPLPRTQKSISMSGSEPRPRLRNRSKIRSSLSGTTSWADWNGVLFCITDKVPDDQEITCEPHLLDHLDFICQTRLIIRDGLFQFAANSLGIPNRLLPPLESISDHLLEVIIS